MRNDMRGRVAVVTGGGSGIGRATALRFAAEGDHVVVNDIHSTTAEETARIAREGGGEALAYAGDVAMRDDVAGLISFATDRFGTPDVVVANAGIALSKSFLDVSESDLQRVLDVNLKGVFFCGQIAAKAMIEAGKKGHIVNIASTYAEVCAPQTTAYCASKGGVRMLTKAMAVDLGEYGIHVNAVAPGWIRTGMNPLEDSEENALLESAIALRHIGSPEQIASVVWFLTSKDAAYVQGEMVFVDGGWVLQ